MPGRRQRLDRACGNRVHTNVLRAQVAREITNRRFEGRLRHTHHVVVGEHPIAADEGEREHAAATAFLHQRHERPGQTDERIGADVERDAEALARRLHERTGELGLRGERSAVDEKVEAAELAIDCRCQVSDLLIARNVARQDERILERRREIAHVLFEPLARIGQRKARAGCLRRLRNGPRNGSLVGHADDEAEFSREVRHVR